jgi:acyl carrier protein
MAKTEMEHFASEGIYQKLTEIFQDVFDDDSIVARPELSAKDVEVWDSVTNVRLFVAIESELGIQFSNAEITHLKNVGELVAAIDRKRSRS